MNFGNSLVKKKKSVPNDCLRKWTHISTNDNCLCKKRTVEHLRRHCKKLFTTEDASPKLQLTSLKQKSMLAESIIGKYSQRQKLAPYVYVSRISDANTKRNQVRKFIDNLDTEHFEKCLRLSKCTADRRLDRRRCSVKKSKKKCYSSRSQAG